MHGTMCIEEFSLRITLLTKVANTNFCSLVRRIGGKFSATAVKSNQGVISNSLVAPYFFGPSNRIELCALRFEAYAAVPAVDVR